MLSEIPLKLEVKTIGLTTAWGLAVALYFSFSPFGRTLAEILVTELSRTLAR